MIRCISLILLCLLLCGCGAQVRPDAQESQPPAQTAPVETDLVQPCLPGHPLELMAPGVLQVFPLNGRARGIRSMGEKLLLLGGDEGRQLIQLTGEKLTVCGSAELSFDLELQDASVQICGETLSYYDPVRRETVVLGAALRDMGRIAAPEGMIGSPVFAADSRILYYCTSGALRAWNLDTGIRRCVREMAYTQQEIVGLHQAGTIVQCRIQDNSREETLFFDAQTGRQLGETPGDTRLEIHGSSYYASVSEGAVHLQLLGKPGESVQMLNPIDVYADCYYLSEYNWILTVSDQEQTTVDCYDLNTGLRTARLEVDGGVTVVDAAEGKDGVFLLLRGFGDSDVLCRWDPTAEVCRTGDSRLYLEPRYTAKSPDTASLAQCRAEAARIGEKYGIRILVWEDVLDAMPWDYEFQPEYLAGVLQRELAELDRRLAHYPPEIFSGISRHFSGLTLCMVRSITGTAESGSLEAANGVQFFQDGEVYIAISVGKYAERALYHELYHVMETRLLTESTAFDRWDALNPADFSYDLDYTTNKNRQAQKYLQPDNRSFIDTYSMSYPKEDRARIMECAMQSGNEALFRSAVMQAKLSCLSRAIREAYGLEKTQEQFRWEQYLTG